jgi:hypothetical protein
MEFTHEIFEFILISFAVFEVLLGIGTITFMLFKHRAKLQLTFLNIMVIYLSALNPFSVRDLTKNLVNYLEEL